MIDAFVFRRALIWAFGMSLTVPDGVSSDTASPLSFTTSPVIVFPSMSGTFAFPFAVAHPELVAGLVPIAPVAITDWGAKLSGSTLPALIVWGEADTVIPLSQAETLHQLLPKSEKLILPKASPPCDLDDPATFHAGLLKFLKPFKPEGPVPAGRRPR